MYMGYSIAAEDADQTSTQTETGIPIQWPREKMLQALEGSYVIWEDLSPTSKEANKVAKALKSMLTKVCRPPAIPNANGIRQEAFKLAYTARASSSSKSVHW
jgi:hypothetical protein